jgi:hypothetical protein
MKITEDDNNIARTLALASGLAKGVRTPLAGANLVESTRAQLVAGARQKARHTVAFLRTCRHALSTRARSVHDRMLQYLGT